MAKEFSPEEKLLNLIKKKKKAPPPPAEQPLGPPAVMVEQRVAPARERPTRFTRPAPSFGSLASLEAIRTMNVALFAMLILIILYVFVDIFLIPPTDISLSSTGEERRAKPVEEIEIKPHSYYSQGMRSKEVFRPTIGQEEPKNLEPQILPDEIIGNLALLGIVTGDIPQAIIEDKKLQKSIFLKEGQSIGGVLLKAIDEGSVTVVYRGEEFSLSL
ncbi:MAG: hypothetical protein ABH875_05895 [Candidatus Omnitrophota bacterium]